MMDGAKTLASYLIYVRMLMNERTHRSLSDDERSRISFGFVDANVVVAPPVRRKERSLNFQTEDLPLCHVIFQQTSSLEINMDNMIMQMDTDDHDDNDDDDDDASLFGTSGDDDDGGDARPSASAAAANDDDDDDDDDASLFGTSDDDDDGGDARPSAAAAAANDDDDDDDASLFSTSDVSINTTTVRVPRKRTITPVSLESTDVSSSPPCMQVIWSKAQKDNVIRALNFLLENRNHQLKEIQADYDDIIDQLKKENESLKKKLLPDNLIHPCQTGSHPDGMIDEEGVAKKKAALNGSNVSSDQFDRHVASYLYDVYTKRLGCRPSFEQLISSIKEDGSWTDDDYLRNFAYAVICCAARAFVPQPKRKDSEMKEGKIISDPTFLLFILSYI